MSNKTIKIIIDQPFNDLPLIPPDKESTETKNILRQVVKSSLALAELKGLVHTLPNPDILLNAVILKEARASSEIEIFKEPLYYKNINKTDSNRDQETINDKLYDEAIPYPIDYDSPGIKLGLKLIKNYSNYFKK